MSEKIKTLILEGNGFGWHTVLIDTFLQGILNLKEEDLSDLIGPFSNIHLIRKILGRRYEALSYVIDWRDAFCESTDLETDVVNINNLIAYNKALSNIKEYSLIIILHSATGDSMNLLLETVSRFNLRHCKIAMFIGNEYLLLDEKIRFIRQAQVDYICSQLPEKTARWLYSECNPSQVLALPAALNPNLYFPDENHRRQIDLGFRGTRYPKFIGDSERNDMLDFFERKSRERGLCIDFGYRTMRRGQWVDFLRNCRAVVGAEAGTYVLDERGHTITASYEYEKKHPKATIEEIYALFFQVLPEHVSGKCISSRHFEPIGTKTCQILLEGKYNDILKADEHYISLKKDYSNFEDVIYRLQDDDYRREMVEHTYEYVLREHTYTRRVQTLIDTIYNDGL